MATVWLTQAVMEEILTLESLIELTDDTAEPDTLNATLLTSVMERAEALCKAVLWQRYSAYLTAGTASKSFETLCAAKAIQLLYLRRGRGSSPVLDGFVGGDLDRFLKDIAVGLTAIPEWPESSMYMQEKVEFQPRVDIYAGYEDEDNIPDEHEDDER